MELRDRGHGAASLLAAGQEGIWPPCRRIFELAGAQERPVVAADPPAAVSGGRATGSQRRRSCAPASSRIRRQAGQIPSWPAASSEAAPWPRSRSSTKPCSFSTELIQFSYHVNMLHGAMVVFVCTAALVQAASASRRLNPHLLSTNRHVLHALRARSPC